MLFFLSNSISFTFLELYYLIILTLEKDRENITCKQKLLSMCVYPFFLYIYRQFKTKQYNRIFIPSHFMLWSDHFIMRKPDFYLIVSQQKYNDNMVHMSILWYSDCLIIFLLQIVAFFTHDSLNESLITHNS